MTRPLLTSIDNPLRIAEVPVGPGLIGITFAPGKQQPHGLTGHHRRDLAADLDRITAWNAAVVVTLVEACELDAFGITQLGSEVRRRHMEWHHWPIRDYGVPDATFEAAWPERSARLRSLLARGGRVLIHCKGGLGRAGTIAGRLLVETGMAPQEAVRAVRAVRPGAIETEAQERWVAAGRALPLPSPDRGRSATRDRALGALLGLAVGDALGAGIEFTAKPSFALLDDMISGGPHRLERGQWTDDTAMALALADSLLHDPVLDAADLMRRFVDWHERGTYSCTGHCFDIGNAISAALNRFRRTGDPLAGSTAEQASGNGALMRLSPVAIRHWRDRDEMQRVAELQTRTTHGAPATLTASRAFATMLADAIEGRALPEVLSGPAADGIEGGWRGLHRNQVDGSGYVVRSLQAAVWAVSRTTDFPSAVLLAANLGEDADTTAAIAGQLAGAIYGARSIPREWLEALAWRERLDHTATQLFEAGWPAADDDDVAAPRKGPEWRLRERLRALAAFRSVFEQNGFVFGEWLRPEHEGELTVLGYYALTPEARRFYETIHDHDWLRMFDWATWKASEEGNRLLHDPEAMTTANEDDLARVLTACVRADRFCEGALAGCFEDGLLTRVAIRAGQLLAAAEAQLSAAEQGEQ